MANPSGPSMTANEESQGIYENVWGTSGKPVDRDTQAHESLQENDEDISESQAFLNREDDTGRHSGLGPRPSSTRMFLIRALALLCACSLSVGSHYASYILGPLKSRLNRELGTSNTEFSLLISAFALNSTWTPLVGGLMVSKLGTTKTSIFATGAIFIGQILLLLGEVTDDIRLMTFGLFIFGLGVSPLAVVQETIIVRFFQSHGLGISMALGLVAGKGASFVSARTSYPLSERYGRHAPFYVATVLAGLSVAVNLIYIAASKWLIQSTGTQLEASEIEQQAQDQTLTLSEAQALEKVAAKRRVRLGDVRKLDNLFWAYIGLNVLCGAIWAPFTHLAANLIQQRYKLSEREAGTQASYLLAGSVALYPICGAIVDKFKKRPIVIQLFLMSSGLQLLCYFWLALPPAWTGTAMPAIISFGAGIGFSPLLLVVIVPQLVPLKYVSTTLGAHKSLEQTGSVIMQTLAGLALDTKHNDNGPSDSGKADLNIQRLLNAWLFLNILHFCTLLGLAELGRRRRAANLLLAVNVGLRSPIDVLTEDLQEDPSGSSVHSDYGSEGSPYQHGTPREVPHSPILSPAQRLSLLIPEPTIDRIHSAPETKRMRKGDIYAGLCVTLIVFAWILFLATAWVRLRTKKEREGTPSMWNI